MPSELERQLEGMLATAPDPDAGAEEAALGRALSALQSPASGRPGLRAAVVVFAAAGVLLAVAAGSLAAAGALHVSLGTKAPPPTKELSLPTGAHGIAAIVDGRLSVVTRAGFRLQGLEATAAALSPHALYVAAGTGDSLVAMAPDGRRVWSHPAAGRVVAISWAPDAIRIAYVVQHGRRLALHVIWGTGTHDTTIDRSVRAVRPSWRADSLGLAYVGAGGKAIVYDLGHRLHSVIQDAAPVTRVAFAPVGRPLLVATPGAAVLGKRTLATGEVEAIGWLHGRPAVALESGVNPPLLRTFSSSGSPTGSFRMPGRILAVAERFVVTATIDRVLAGRRPVLGLAPGQTVRDLQIG